MKRFLKIFVLLWRKRPGNYLFLFKTPQTHAVRALLSWYNGYICITNVCFLFQSFWTLAQNQTANLTLHGSIFNNYFSLLPSQVVSGTTWWKNSSEVLPRIFCSHATTHSWFVCTLVLIYFVLCCLEKPLFAVFSLHLPSSIRFSALSSSSICMAAHQRGQRRGRGEGDLCGRPRGVHQRTEHRRDAALRGRPHA